MENSNKLNVIITASYSKLIAAVPTGKTIAIEVSQVFVKDRIVLYGIFERLLTDNSLQFV